MLAIRIISIVLGVGEEDCREVVTITEVTVLMVMGAEMVFGIVVGRDEADIVKEMSLVEVHS